MTQRPGLLPAVLLIAVTNLAPLAGWWWNRSGTPLATVDLSEREAAVRHGNDENSSVWLQLIWGESWNPALQPAWADSASLARLGFEPARLGTGEVEQLASWRPRRRPAWVLLRVDEGVVIEAGSRLVPVAVGREPGALYRMSGDRNTHLVVRGVVRVGRQMLPVDSLTGESAGESWSAAVDYVTPSTLHVPRSLVTALEELASGATGTAEPRYMVRVGVGRFYLPRVSAVFPAP